LYKGQAYVSIVGFRFEAVRLYGIPVPGHASFPEINLRFYVRRHVGDSVRRGVVFVREIAPRRAVAIVANRFFHENYITRPMRSGSRPNRAALARGDTIEYAWRTNVGWPWRGRPHRGQLQPQRGRLQPDWSRLAVTVASPLTATAPGSLDEFIVEHYWGYGRARDGGTREYRVTHEPWATASAQDIRWEGDFATTYGAEFARYLDEPPTSAIVAAGSPVRMYRSRRLLYVSHNRDLD
jgi:uncharacterized protein YqjF (DUF2071 family)